jgi:hypothetical protein
MAAATALAIGTIAAPAAAVTPSIGLVNGYPGRVVDVCVGNAEVKSRLTYGRGVVRSIGIGTKTVRFRAASAGSCNGNILGTKVLTLVDDDDRTIVLSRSGPNKVVEFINTPVPTDPEINYIYLRHAGTMGSVVISFEDQSFATPAVAPTPFVKGDTDLIEETTPEPMLFGVYLENGLDPIVLKQYLTLEGRRQEFIVVGSSKSNARLATLVRPLALP